MPGGVYGLVIDRRNIYAATRQSGGMVEAFDRATLQPVATYGLSASPRAMTCDGKHIYAIASGAPYLYDIHPKDIF